MTIALELTDEMMAKLADCLVPLVVARIGKSGSPWMTRKEAADYLRLPLSRLEKDRSIPSHRDDGRVLYNRDELDAHFLALGPCGT